jgi:hypothetical protein
MDAVRTRLDTESLRLRGILTAELRAPAPDVMVEALLYVLERRSVFDEAKHPRNPKGSPGGGKFKSIAQRIEEALTQHHAGKGDGAPLKDFTRPQLLKVARERGLTVPRGLPDKDLHDLIIAHHRGGVKMEPPAKAKKAVKSAEHAGEKASPSVASATDTARQKKLRELGAKKPAKTKALSGGIMADGTHLKTYDDGTMMVSKEYGGKTMLGAKHAADGEQLGARIMEAVGARHAAVVRTGPGGIDMEWVPGKTGAEFGYGDGFIREANVPASIVDSDDGRLMGLADFIMGNEDRNPGNWIKTADGHIVGIDHGRAFESVKPDSFVSVDNSPFNDHLIERSGEGGWKANLRKTNDFTKADMAAVRERLVAMREEFVKAKRLNWYNLALRRIDAVAKGAKGTRNLVAP